MKEVSVYNSTPISADQKKGKLNSLENKISYYHVALFLIMLPFDRFYSQLVLLSLLLHTIIHFNKYKLRSVLNRQNVILSSMFLLTIAGTLWTNNKEEALKDIERQSAIFLFPFLLSATGLDLHLYKKRLLTIFGLTCVITILFLYADAVKIILYHNLPLSSLLTSTFINHNFTEPIGLHATYLSMYVALSIATFFYFFLFEKNKKNRFLYVLAMIILFIGLIQLASKSVLIAIIIFIPFGFLLFMTKKKGKYRVFITALVISLLTLFAITRIETFNERYIGGFKDDLTQAIPENEIADPRILRWHCALSLIKQAPLLGHGSGSEKELLKEKYFENKLYNSYLKELNAHNQYLSVLLQTGVFGLIVFLVTLYTGFASAWLNKDFVCASFLIIICIVSFSENILDVNKGIFFYAFFLSFFVLSGKPLVSLSPFPKQIRLTEKPPFLKTYSDI